MKTEIEISAERVTDMVHIVGQSINRYSYAIS